MMSGAQGAAKVETTVTRILQDQMEAWNNGDLDKFMSFYLESPEISYTSGGKVVWGFEALRKRYVDKYGSSKETMGKLSFSNLRISELGSSNALCLGQWHLERDGQPPFDGIFSLVFSRTNSGWKIIHDHTSLKVD